MTKKNFEARIKLTKAEHDKVKTKASKLGLSVSAFGRFLLLNSSIEAISKQN